MARLSLVDRPWWAWTPPQVGSSAPWGPQPAKDQEPAARQDSMASHAAQSRSSPCRASATAGLDGRLSTACPSFLGTLTFLVTGSRAVAGFPTAPGDFGALPTGTLFKDGGVPPRPARMSPRIGGRMRWLGTGSLAFPYLLL